GTTNMTFTLTRNGTSAFAQTVRFTLVPDTAAPPDYTGTGGQVTFMPNATTATFVVAINGDTGIEPTETFFVNLANTGNATLADTQGVGTIINDDLVAPTTDVSITKTAPAN